MQSYDLLNPENGLDGFNFRLGQDAITAVGVIQRPYDFERNTGGGNGDLYIQGSGQSIDSPTGKRLLSCAQILCH